LLHFSFFFFGKQGKKSNNQSNNKEKKIKDIQLGVKLKAIMRKMVTIGKIFLQIQGLN
jgi:hypothetical protein